MSSRTRKLIRRLFCLAAWPLLITGLRAQVNVLTANYDNSRGNANLGEFVLNKANVNSKQFGKLYALPVDGQVYAQPLYVLGVNMATGPRDVLYVATMHNSVYAFDANASSAAPPLWTRNFGPSVNPHNFDVPTLPYHDILNEIGILGTPVIDPSTSTLYVVHYLASDSSGDLPTAYYLHALDLATGQEKFGGPVKIQATVTGSGWGGLDITVNNQLAFDADQHLQRPGLLLMDGNLYLGFGSHGDIGPWHGWIIEYNAATLQQVSVFNSTAQNAGGASFWQAGKGLAADAAGNIYCSTGNGTWDGEKTWGQSVLRLSTSGGLSVADFFTPAEYMPLNLNDTDMGATGPVLVPGTNLLMAIGKEGVLFLLDQTNLGHQAPLNSQIVQSFQAGDQALTLTQQEGSFLIFNTAIWDNYGGTILYLWPQAQPLTAYRMKNGMFDTTPFSSNATPHNSLPFSGMAVSANGSLSSSGILWITALDSYPLPAPGTLYAFDALDLSVELWDSDSQGTRDTLGSFSKFANPTVANGKVFVPTASGQIVVYGLLPDVPAVASVVNSASFASGDLAPGELVTIFGTSIGPSAPASTSFTPSTGQLPSTLDGIQVTFGGKAAPLLYGSAGQINAIVPFEVAGQSTVAVAITNTNGGSLSLALPVSAANPSIFSANSSGSGQGAIVNADLTKNSAANPAARGSVVEIYATGLGATTPASTDGVLTPAMNPPLIAQPVTVTIGGQNAQVMYQGAAPGLVAGVSQINVRVPAGVTPGSALPVTIKIGGVTSVNTVTMAVK